MKIPSYFRHAKALQPINYSGFIPDNKHFCIAKKHRYTIVPVEIMGEAPKDVIRLYEYGKGIKKISPKTWPVYIAKLGIKYYPNESITENFISEAGNILGFKMAQTKLCIISGQIRLLSRYFLNKNERLEHGADIYMSYLEDPEFVHEINQQKKTRDFFTVTFTKNALKHTFPENHQEIFKQFMRMLFFDALMGNNDRHLYNWAIIRNNIHQETLPIFSPIYDSARGLFWNSTEQKIRKILSSGNLKQSIIKYAETSHPKIGLEKNNKNNHFDLISAYKSHYLTDSFLISIFEENKLGKIFDLLQGKYKFLFTENRKVIIEELLKYRFSRIKEILEI